MQVLHLDTLPEFARRELMDFYQFLLQKYAIQPSQAKSRSVSIAPRLVKPFKPLSREEMYER